MKLKCNLLYKEKADLKSQLEKMFKELKRYKLFHKDWTEQQHVHNIVVQVKVCV